MVLVADRVCVDRWESILVDKPTQTLLSPYYPPNRKIALAIAQTWEKQRFEVGGPLAQAMGLPPLSAWQHANDPEPMAVSKPGVVPNGYVSGILAEQACTNAGKRLCQQEEWLVACEGQAKRPYPYGDKYVPGACNIFRGKHPAAELHDDPSSGHLDPRLNLVKDAQGPLLRKTGETATCGSVWGDDTIWDMNGNLDEWVEDEKGRFLGGFFSRSKKDGCLSSVGAHPKNYFDYSTGVRCCADVSR
jgi:formylglycine-generating enzyme required for sulfatase activity